MGLSCEFIVEGFFGGNILSISVKRIPQRFKNKCGCKIGKNRVRF
jgi:hypothetical protein